jgi:hypothetical protein
MEGEFMVIVPLSRGNESSQVERCRGENECANWVGIAAAGALLAGGVLLLTGHRRAGTVAATSGAALTLIGQQELVRSWWNQLPVSLNHIEQMLDQAQATLEQAQEMVDNLAAKREKLRTLLKR